MGIGKGTKLTVLETNLTAVKMLLSCFDIRQSIVAFCVTRPTSGRASDVVTCYARFPLIVQVAERANFLDTVDNPGEPVEGRNFVAEMSQDFRKRPRLLG